MAGRLNSIAGRLVLIVLLVQALLMPVLFATLETAIKRNMIDAFLDDARIHARIIGDTLEEVDIGAAGEDVIKRLDSVILSGRSVYAVISYGDRSVASTLMSDVEIGAFRENFNFGEHDDDTYFLSVPISQGEQTAILRLGFDESPTRENLETIRSATIYALVAYLLLSLLATAYMSSTIVKPLKWLQRASRAISSGEIDKELKAESDLVEIRELSEDLETMRSKLVGMYARLQEETAERELAESERRNLESRLRHAQRLESLGTLAGGVAHEFNNVLQPMLLYTDLALEDLPKDSAIAANLKRVLDLAKRAKGLSQQILTFGRQDTEAEFEILELTPIVHEALTMIKALLPATVDLRVDISNDIGMVKCDSTQIKQLIVNLCNNAFQAMLKTGGHIHVSLKEVIVPQGLARKHPTLRTGEYVVLQVADTGKGMDQQTVRRIFEPFFTTQDVGQGTGLGLSVVHGIVMRHGGEIILESELGKGSRFRIYLPLVEEDAQEINRESEE